MFFFFFEKGLQASYCRIGNKRTKLKPEKNETLNYKTVYTKLVIILNTLRVYRNCLE